MPYHYDPADLNPLDNELGRLIRFMPYIDNTLLVLLASAHPQRTWLELNLMRSSDLVKLWEATIPAFPSRDHKLLAEHVEDAKEVYELRNIMVHGRWWSVQDADHELYMVEKVMPKAEAKRETGRRDWSPDEHLHPARYMPINLAGVARTLRIAKRLHRYLDKHLDHWEKHFSAAN